MNVQISCATQAWHVVPRVAEAGSSFNRSYRGLLAGLGVAAVFLVSGSALAATKPSLGAAESFSALAHLSMAAANPTTVSGDLGLSSGLLAQRTGTWNVSGSQYFGPSSLAFTANANALSAYNNLAGQGSDGAWGGAVWSPVPGVYTVASDVTYTGAITLNGGYNDVWVFQVGRDMTFAGSSSVTLTGNAQACNVFWVIARDATIASGAAFGGTLIAHRDITVVTGASANSRIISLDSSLTTDGNTISGPTCAVAPPASPAQLGLAKTVVNTGGGTALASAFTLTATGPAVISGTAPVAATNAPVGVYTLTETGPAGYMAGLFSCSGGGTLAGNLLTIAAADAGNTITCTITNTFSSIPVPPPPSAAASIPTLSEWAMMLLIFLMAIVGFTAMRKQAR